jgi:hypothetical protein
MDYEHSSPGFDNNEFIYSSICGESIVEGEKKPLLRRLPATTRGNWSTNIEAPFYIPLKNNNILGEIM